MNERGAEQEDDPGPASGPTAGANIGKHGCGQNVLSAEALHRNAVRGVGSDALCHKFGNDIFAMIAKLGSIARRDGRAETGVQKPLA